MIAYDIEAQLVQQSNGVYNHEPVLLVMNMSCDLCREDGCEICGDKWYVFRGEECVDDFVDKIKELSAICDKKKSSLAVFAHNNARYDGHFVFRSMMKKGIKGMDVTMRGLGLLKVEIGNVRFIDSNLILMAPLAKLPKMFGLEGETKGFFPYYFKRREEVVKYRDIPKSEFGYGQMSIERATEFDDWYIENSDVDFLYDRECETYCRSDVRILMESIKMFRKLSIESNKIDPLCRMFTIASIGFEYFRAKILKPKTMNISPINGFDNGKQSASGNAWLDIIEKDMMKKYNSPIIREFKIGNYSVDGFIDTSSMVDNKVKGIILEFKGCYSHKHSCSFDKNIFKAKNERDMKREYFLRNLGYDIIIMWECEWKKILRENPALKRYFNERCNLYKYIMKNELWVKARDAYHGGLTDNFKFVGQAEYDEEIKYLDFNSLYPYVMMNYDIPIGKPTIIRSGCEKFTNPEELKKVFGLVSCKVLPPGSEKYPCLPVVINGKLMFPLC